MSCDTGISVIALVLAAGRSRRFGTDKRQARLADGRSLLQASLAVAHAGFDDTWVVVRPSESGEALSLPADARLVQAPTAHEGLGSSLGAGFAALLQSDFPAQAAAVMLADMPWLLPATCQILAAHAGAERIVAPHHAGRRGHPVVFGRAFWPALSQVQGDQGARDILKAYARALHLIEVDDPGIHADVDTPTDLAPDFPGKARNR